MPPVEWVPYFDLKRPFEILQRRILHLGLWYAHLYLFDALVRDFLFGFQ